ncbi:tetratricopeptide repeat-containing sensor histidine kinase [uncultured Proteiniphilum sp.]|uniref:ATP-binding protein n=1 Tax=uncultured Proteiniphilum sp. TaxID=497637 RepID=UPI00260C9412|nr:tetratricopeptide repeat-containing sensor histidine kinase [uncultured Proteiniphilum sp.]
MHPQLAPVRYGSVSCNGDRPALYRTGLLLIVLFLFFSCVQKEKDQYSLDEKKKKWEEKISRMDLSVDSLRLLLEESVSVRDDVAISLLCRELGERMRISSDFSDAIAYHQQGLVAAYNIRDTLGITQALNNIGTDFRRIGALPEASDYHYQALQMAESFSGRNGKTGRKNRIMAINGIGNVHLSFGNLDEAENMFREALSEEKALGSDLGQAINYANIGAVFEEKQRYDSAFFYYQRSMEHNMLAKSQLGIGLCYIHFGHIYELQNEFDKAEREYQLAYDVMNGISDPWHWLEATLAIARIRLHKNDEKESLKYINLSRQAAAEIRSPEHLSKAYHLLHEYNLKRGDFTAALNDFKISKSFEDTIQNIQKLNKVIDMRLNYERNKYRQNIAHLNLRNEMEARQKSTILYASVISVALLIFSLIALFYAYIQRTNSNKILRKLNRVRTNFFTNVTHEFRTPLTVILGLSNQLQAEKEITPAEMNSYLRAIDRQGTHLLSLVNQLLDMSKIDAGIDNPQWQKGNIVVYVQMVVDSFRLYAKNKNLKLIFLSSEPTIIMDFIPHYIDNILQNLVSNAIKFSSAGSEIFVTTARVNNKFTLKIADAGEGIAKEDLEHVFELFYQGNRTDKNSGSGIGLSYTRQMVEMMNGKIEVESEDKRFYIYGDTTSATLRRMEVSNPESK